MILPSALNNAAAGSGDPTATLSAADIVLIRDAVWTHTDRSLNTSVTVGVNNDKTNYTLTAQEHTDLVDEVWDEVM